MSQNCWTLWVYTSLCWWSSSGRNWVWIWKWVWHHCLLFFFFIIIILDWLAMCLLHYHHIIILVVHPYHNCADPKLLAAIFIDDTLSVPIVFIRFYSCYHCCCRTMIQNFKKEGKIVPSEVTVKLLQQAMQQSENKKFIIDGFPRNEENWTAFENIVSLEFHMSTNSSIICFFYCAS